MAQTQVLKDEDIKKIKAIARTAVKVGKSAKVYLELLRNLNKTVPKETRSATAKYAAIMRRALNGKEYDPVELASALIEMKREWRSWKAEHKQDIDIIKAAAKQYFKDLKSLIDLTQ